MGAANVASAPWLTIPSCATRSDGHVGVITLNRPEARNALDLDDLRRARGRRPHDLGPLPRHHRRRPGLLLGRRREAGHGGRRHRGRPVIGRTPAPHPGRRRPAAHRRARDRRGQRRRRRVGHGARPHVRHPGGLRAGPLRRAVRAARPVHRRAGHRPAGQRVGRERAAELLFTGAHRRRRGAAHRPRRAGRAPRGAAAHGDGRWPGGSPPTRPSPSGGSSRACGAPSTPTGASSASGCPTPSAELFRTDDHREGVAFLEKRPPTTPAPEGVCLRVRYSRSDRAASTSTTAPPRRIAHGRRSTPPRPPRRATAATATPIERGRHPRRRRARPKEMGGPGGATNPEQLFAAGYAACFHSALKFVAAASRPTSTGSEVSATVTSAPSPGRFGLASSSTCTPPTSIDAAALRSSNRRTRCARTPTPRAATSRSPSGSSDGQARRGGGATIWIVTFPVSLRNRSSLSVSCSYPAAPPAGTSSAWDAGAIPAPQRVPDRPGLRRRPMASTDDVDMGRRSG